MEYVTSFVTGVPRPKLSYIYTTDRTENGYPFKRIFKTTRKLRSVVCTRFPREATCARPQVVGIAASRGAVRTRGRRSSGRGVARRSVRCRSLLLRPVTYYNISRIFLYFCIASISIEQFGSNPDTERRYIHHLGPIGRKNMIINYYEGILLYC